MRRLISIVLMIVITAVPLIITSVKDDSTSITAIVELVDDSGRIYQEVNLNQAQKDMEPLGFINALYTSSEHQVFYVTAHGGFNGDIELIVLLNNGVIEALSGINIHETPEYGGKAFKAAYLNQFIGMDLKTQTSITYGGLPDGNTDIVVVTHATYTSRAIVNAVRIIIGYIQA